MKSWAVTVTSSSGGEYLMPGFRLNVHVSPSADCSGNAEARSGWTSAPPSAVVIPLYESSVRSRQQRSNAHATVLRWTHAGVVAEGRDEVRERVEPRPLADLRHAERGLSQQVRRVADPEPDQVAVRGDAVALLEDAGEVEGRQGRGASHRVHVQIL